MKILYCSTPPAVYTSNGYTPAGSFIDRRSSVNACEPGFCTEVVGSTIRERPSRSVTQTRTSVGRVVSSSSVQRPAVGLG